MFVVHFISVFVSTAFYYLILLFLLLFTIDVCLVFIEEMMRI